MSHAAELDRDHARHRAEWETFAESIRCACGKPAVVVIVEAEEGWCSGCAAAERYEAAQVNRSGLDTAWPPRRWRPL